MREIYHTNYHIQINRQYNTANDIYNLTQRIIAIFWNIFTKYKTALQDRLKINTNKSQCPTNQLSQISEAVWDTVAENTAEDGLDLEMTTNRRLSLKSDHKLELHSGHLQPAFVYTSTLKPQAQAKHS